MEQRVLSLLANNLRDKNPKGILGGVSAVRRCGGSGGYTTRLIYSTKTVKDISNYARGRIFL